MCPRVTLLGANYNVMFFNVNCAFASLQQFFLIFGLTLERWITIAYLLQHLVNFYILFSLQ